LQGDPTASRVGEASGDYGRGGHRRPGQGRPAAGAGEGGGRSRRGRRPEQERAAAGVGEEDNVLILFWGLMEKKRKKRKTEIGKFTKKNPILSLPCHLTMRPDVRNRVKPAKNTNQCTLQQILAKSVVFYNFAK
jgi:hypothetical protein